MIVSHAWTETWVSGGKLFWVAEVQFAETTKVTLKTPLWSSLGQGLEPHATPPQSARRKSSFLAVTCKSEAEVQWIWVSTSPPFPMFQVEGAPLESSYCYHSILIHFQRKRSELTGKFGNMQNSCLLLQKAWAFCKCQPLCKLGSKCSALEGEAVTRAESV